MRKRTARSAGFTIIELLVATAVFAVVLVVVTTGIMQVSRVYYKGLTEANTQATARSIIDIISQAIQFSGGDVTETPGTTPGTPFAFCVGNQQFSYTLGYQLMDNPAPSTFQSYHVLVVNSLPGCSSSSAAQDVRLQTVSGRELMSTRMRLSNLSVENLGNHLYEIKVRVVYGDDDLLTTPETSPTTACRNVRAGTQFCAVSELSTVVIKRVE